MYLRTRAGTALCIVVVMVAVITMSRQPMAQQAAAEALATDTPRMLIFISLAMPASQLRQLAAEARRLQAVLLLRSFPDTNTDTATASAKNAYEAIFTDSEETAVLVDPFSFHDYQVSEVPVYILLAREMDVAAVCHEQLQQCEPPYYTVRVSGAASAGAALQFMRQEKSITAEVDIMLRRLGAGGGS